MIISTSVPYEISSRDAHQVIDPKGQLLIPKVIREGTGLKPGTLVRLKPLECGQLLVERIVNPTPFQKMLAEELAPAVARKQKK